MLSASKPSWQQVTALVSLSASGTVTGFSFVPHSPTDLMSPTSMPVRLMALERSVKPAASGDAALRSAIVNVASYYHRMAQDKTPAEMEAIIWQHDSVNGADHGESCAAFASLTLELAAQVVGQQSWVTGGTSYPWPLQKWADVRVDPNPSSPNIISVLQDAEAHGRWHPLGDGYQPQPGDWVLFNNHVEVVTKYAGGTLDTIGGDSLPNFSVNTHEYPAPLSGDGVVGFVNNGTVPAAAASSDSGNGAGTASTDSAGTAGTDSAGTTAPGDDATSSPAASKSGAPGHAASNHASAARALTNGRTAGNAAIPGATGTSGSGPTSTSIPGATSSSTPAATSSGTPGATSSSITGATTTADSGAAGTTDANSGRGPARDHRASRSTVAASAHESRTLPTVPGVATNASTPSATHDPAVPGTPSSMIPVASSHIAQQTHRDHGPTANKTPPVRHGATATQPVHAGHRRHPAARADANADVPGMGGLSESAATAQATTSHAAAIPGLAERQSKVAAPYRRHESAHVTAPVKDTWTQQAFIDEVAPGAIASQQKYGIPAAVTIAQAIDESGWGQSQLASQDNNLFGIKGEGPAGSDSQPTQEYENGQWITIDAGFRVYHDVTQSIDDHGELLASSGYYTHAMAARNHPDAFANALTGVYATNPDYGSDLIQLMRQYDLYRYDASRTGAAADASGTGAGANAHASGTAAGATANVPAKAANSSAPVNATSKPGTPTSKPGTPTQPSLPGLMPTASPSPAPTPTPPASPSPGPRPTATADPTPAPAQSTPEPERTRSAEDARSAGTDHVRGTPGSSPVRSASTPALGASQPRTSRTLRPSILRTPQPRTSRTPQPRTSRTPPPRTSHTPQPRTAQSPQPHPSQTPEPHVERTPEPVVAPTYEAGWVAGSGIAMGTAMTGVRRRIKRAERGNAVDAHDQATPATVSSTLTGFADRPSAPDRPWPPAEPDPDRAPVRRYQHRLPTSVKNDFVATARGPLLHGELLYRDVADSIGLSWELLAACDWMQCQARPRYSPVHGEKLGARNHDGTVYWSRSEALGQCAMDLIYLADAVYGIDLTTELQLSVADLARVFAAFRWGALLKRHRTSAMEFPYSVAGLTVQHMNMRWPNIGDPNTPDKPGTRFRKPFGAVPIVLSLHYPATV